ncbi:hypothetical protein TNCV_5068471 [Trichonephila clavipes]|nr:hypothetical protein TNCV_5068471 [Trichonephila clavipes]
MLSDLCKTTYNSSDPKELHNVVRFTRMHPCQLCSHAKKDDDLLLQCTGLDEYPTDDVLSRCREAQHQIVKHPAQALDK